MGLETATFVNDLNSSNPTVNDVAVQGDDHLRLLKAALKATFPNADHAIYLEQDRADVASGATTDIGAVSSNYVNITGTTTITALGTVHAGVVKYIRFNAILTLTYNATSVILPGAANITTAAGDHCIAVSKGAGNWVVLAFFRTSGEALIFSNINNLTADTAPDGTADYVPSYDTSATGNKKVLINNLFKAVSSLTEDTTPDTAADFFVMYDASAAAPKKVLPSSLITVSAATQADMEAATSTSTIVTPAVVKNHPGVAKCWAYITVAGGTPTLAANYNITSIADTAVGKVTITIATDFSSANWTGVATIDGSSNGGMSGVTFLSQAAGSIILYAQLRSDAAFDPVSYSFAGFGDQ